MARLIATVFATFLATDALAQCADGSPPPCAPRRPPYVSASTRQLPDSLRVLFNRALEEGRRRTLPGSEASFGLLQRIIARDSNYAPAWAALARVAQMGWVRRWPLAGATRDSLLALAIVASRRAVQLDSGSAIAWVVFAKAAGTVDVGDRTASRRALERALRIDPRHAEAWFELGLLEEELLRPAAARRAYERALAAAPGHLEALTFLQLNHYWRGDFERARRLADSVLTIDPTFAIAREAAIDIALVQRRWADAERHVRILQATGGAQEPARAEAALARVAQGMGDTASARTYIRQAEGLAGITAPTRHAAAFMGAAWAQLGDTARAMEWIAAYQPRDDLHFQLHLKRDPDLRWLAARQSALVR